MRGLGAMLLTVILALGAGTSGAEVAVTIKDFYGTYSGVGSTRARGGFASDRGLGVIIRPSAGGGFQVIWSTVIDRRSAKRQKRRTRTLTFRPTGQPRRWRAGESGDPMKGGFISWARLEGRVLIVYVFAVDAKTGELTASIWRRRLGDAGLRINYSRLRDEQLVRGVFAIIKRRK